VEEGWRLPAMQALAEPKSFCPQVTVASRRDVGVCATLAKGGGTRLGAGQRRG